MIGWPDATDCPRLTEQVATTPEIGETTAIALRVCASTDSCSTLAMSRSNPALDMRRCAGSASSS